MDKDIAVNLLENEVSLYDKKERILFVPDVNDDGRYYGIQEFHINLSEERLDEEIKKHGSLTQMCLGCIPAPGAAQNYADEYGYSVLVGNEVDPEEYGIDFDNLRKADYQQLNGYYDAVRNAYESFVDDLDLANITVDPVDYENITGKEWIDEEAREQPENSMTEEQLQHKLYDIYQLDWMMYHGCSISDIIQGMENQPHDEFVFEEEDYGGQQVDVAGIYNYWEQNSGFKGEIFACFEEFCENEYLDATYMHDLMNSQPIELTDKLEELYGEFMMAREEREMQEEKDRYFSPDLKEVFHLSEEVFQHISEVLEKEQEVIEDRAKAAE